MFCLVYHSNFHNFLLLLAGPFAIGISLVTGEIAFAIGMLVLIKRPVILTERVVFLLKNLLFVGVPVLLRFLVGDAPVSL